MKRLLLMCVCVVLLAACEDDGNNSSRFDDLITSFDLSQMDQTQFVEVLTSEMLCFNDVDVYEEGYGWGVQPLGAVLGWYGILCAPDGTSKYVTKYPPISPEIISGVVCANGRWTYDQKMCVFTIDASQYDKIEAKVVYFKYPRLILEGTFGKYRYVLRWDCTFSKDDPQALLDSCTSFIDVKE